MRDGLLQRPGAPPIRVADGEILLEGDVATARSLRVAMAHSNLELTGRIPLTAMMRYGIVLDLLGIAAIVAAVALLGPLVIGRGA